MLQHKFASDLFLVLIASIFRRNRDYSHQGGEYENSLLIGDSNFKGYNPIGSFTIDELELLQDNRQRLLNMGHIQRGMHCTSTILA